MKLPKCTLKMPDGRILEGTVCGYADTGQGRCVVFWHDHDTWGVYPVGRIIPIQKTLF